VQVVADAIHQRLRSYILSAEWRPNHRLVEEELAEELEASRTPVREALLRLEQEGLVERSRGWVVRTLQYSDIRNILETRIAVEGFGARLAALRIPVEDIKRLRDLARQMEMEGQTRITLNTLNNEFHSIIVAATGNDMLVEFHARTALNYWNFYVPVEFTTGDMVIVNQEHNDLIESLATGNADDAEAIARTHVENTMRIVLSAFHQNG
jgi:DNA-binding GntR family transcriptional regulator